MGVIEVDDNEPGMIIDNGTEMGRRGLAFELPKGARGKVGHPEFVHRWGFKGFGGTADGLAECPDPSGSCKRRSEAHRHSM